MSGCFRQRVIAFFLERKLLNERLARNMLEWTHSGFPVNASIRIPAGSAEPREALAQYVVRPPVSRQPRRVRLAPEGWKRDHPLQPSLRIGLPEEPQPELSLSVKQSRPA